MLSPMALKKAQKSQMAHAGIPYALEVLFPGGQSSPFITVAVSIQMAGEKATRADFIMSVISSNPS